MPSSVKTLYIHIGTGKTGTTAIQNFLYENREVLKNSYGIQYCETGLVSRNHRGLDINATKRRLADYRKIKLRLYQLNHEIISSNCHDFIISDEDFPGLSVKEIRFYRKILFSDFNIKIIVYLRRQDKFLESWFNQIVKAGNYGADINILYSQLLKNKILDYCYLLDKWQSVFGRDNIFARVFERELLQDGNSVKDFMALICSEMIDLDMNYFSNDSLSVKNLNLIREIHKRGWSELFLNSNKIEWLIKNQDKGVSKFILDDEFKEEVLADCDSFNVRLSKLYFNGKDVFPSLKRVM